MSNLMSKLTSRKFWAAVIAFVTELLVAFNVSDSVVTQVTSIILAGATVIAYVFAEGMVDAKRIDQENSEDTTEE